MPSTIERYDANGVLLSRVEVPATPAEVNYANLYAQAVAAFERNRAAIVRNTASVAVANPTTPQVIAAVKDSLRQLSDLEAQMNAVIRLLLNLLDGTD